MIKLTDKTKQDFLSPEWCKKLVEAGIDMSDAHYVWQCHEDDTPTLLEKGDFILDYPIYSNGKIINIPTYTLSELLYKLDEWPFYEVVDPNGAKGTMHGLSFYKDAPFYIFGYRCDYGNGRITIPDEWGIAYEHPIESAAALLIKCKESGIGYVTDISDK